MESDNEDLVGSFRNLGLREGDRSTSQACGSCQVTELQDIIRQFTRSSNLAVLEAERFRSRLENTNAPSTAIVQKLRNEDLADLIRNVRNAMKLVSNFNEKAVFDSLLSLGERDKLPATDRSNVEELLSCHSGEISNIIQKVLASVSNPSHVLLAVAEECYRQATDIHGRLDSGICQDQRAERCLEWPYDPDYEAEAYYEHEDLLDIDENYRNAHQQRLERKLEVESRDRQTYKRCWIDFCIQVVNNSPGGPTLFHPPASSDSEHLCLYAAEIPSYLFRTFDNRSPGSSNAEVVSSVLSASGSEESRIDLLTLEEERAISLLHKHLANNKPSDSPVTYDDNLVSWTNSPLFAIQYAVYRLHNEDITNSKSDINICAVDTTDFLRGQFVRDICLIESYYEAAVRLDIYAFDFFRFRLQRKEFDNGEYLSQGALYHAGRSCLVSLPQLEEAGLYDLFPEFSDPRGYREWYKRCKELRESYWSVRQNTSKEEIHLSLKLGSCFSRSNRLNMAIMLLAFKNRNLKIVRSCYGIRPIVEFLFSAILLAYLAVCHTAPNNFFVPPRWATRPVEVRRYWEITMALKMSGKANAIGGGLTSVSIKDDPLTNYQTLRDIFA
ncbi:hypothetical protein PG996_011179 [Apiospora saccharicola]|uniref:Uncharacterized protein n=1 Tax=Apiospora saccharicola TaxID=335842 RepID=A0ABR1UEA6_9PEZI